jgi:hypothetical protein
MTKPARVFAVHVAAEVTASSRGENGYATEFRDDRGVRWFAVCSSLLPVGERWDIGLDSDDARTGVVFGTVAIREYDAVVEK